MIIYLLMIFFAILLCLVYKMFKKDIVSPSFLMISGYCLSTLCAIYNIEYWLIDLNIETLLVLLYGTGIFVIVGYLMQEYNWNESSVVDAEVKYRINKVIWKEKNIKFFLFFQILTIIIWLLFIYYITSNIGVVGDFSDRMIEFRKWNSYSNDWISNIPYRIILQLLVFADAAAYIVVFYLLWNCYSNNSIIINKLALLAFAMSVIQLLLTGARASVVTLLFYGIVLCLLLFRITNGIFLKINIKKISLLVCAFCILCILFYIGKVFVGRGAHVSIDDFLPYMTMYAGGPIQLLDMYINDPIEYSNILGKETFHGFNFFLSKWGLVNYEPYIGHLEFRYAINGAFLGNVYPSFRSYIYDFGFIGLTIMPMIFSCLTHFLYFNVIYNRGKWLDLYLFFYAYIAFFIAFDFTRDRFFIWISPTLVKWFAILLFLKFVFIKDSDQIIYGGKKYE